MTGFRWSTGNIAQVVAGVGLFSGWAVRRLEFSDPLALSLIGVGVAATVVAFWQSLSFRRVAKQRQILGEQLRWNVVEKLPAYANSIHGFPFGRGRKQKAELAAYGAYTDTYGAAFTLEFTRGRSKLTHIQEYDIVLLELPAALPSAYVLPLDSVEAAKTLAGVDRSRFELVEFNDRWRVTGPDKKFVHALVHPLLIDVLMELGDDVAPICLADGALYSWSAKRLSAEEVTATLAKLDAVRRTIPAFVWNDYAGEPNPRLGTVFGESAEHHGN